MAPLPAPLAPTTSSAVEVRAENALAKVARGQQIADDLGRGLGVGIFVARTNGRGVNILEQGRGIGAALLAPTSHLAHVEGERPAAMGSPDRELPQSFKLALLAHRVHDDFYHFSREVAALKGLGQSLGLRGLASIDRAITRISRGLRASLGSSRASRSQIAKIGRASCR